MRRTMTLSTALVFATLALLLVIHGSIPATAGESAPAEALTPLEVASAMLGTPAPE